MDGTNTTTQDQGTVQATDNGAPATDTTPAKLWATKAEAEANKPADAPKGMRPFEVSKAGVVVGWVNGRGYDHCLAQLARLDGYTVSTGVKQAPVTKEAVAAKLATFTDAELAAMGLTRKPQRGKK
jgi:hypothetical protein